MSQESAAFFTLDRGTVSTAAALIAPVDGRYRLLAASAAPSAIAPESLLEDLAWRVARTDASVAGSLEGWRDWSRLEVRTVRAPRAVLVAASAQGGELLQRAFAGAGWVVTARFFGATPDIVALGEALLDPRVDAVIMAGRDEVDEAEADAAARLWSRVGSLARFRDDLAVIACGPFAERPAGIPDSRLFALPAPAVVPLAADSQLRAAAAQVGTHLVTGGEPGAADGRAAHRTAMASLAAVLGGHIDGLDIGVSAGSRTVVGADGSVQHATLATAGVLPPELLDDEAAGDAVLRWSTLAGDPAARLDGLRELASAPWSRIDEEGVHLRLASLRAAIERLSAAWDGSTSDDEPAAVHTLVLSGGTFAAVPPAAAALAVIDGIRRPGALVIRHDAAAVLAPLGALPVEEDRRRLLLDLMDDCLLPLGSALLTGALGKAGRKEPARGSLHVSSTLGDEQLYLEPGQLRLVDLPPGISARLGLEAGEGATLAAGRRLDLDVRGGLGGLLVDTRAIPLELPEQGEQRRAMLAGWEAPAWIGSDR